MKTKLKSLLIPILLCGAWGVFTYLIVTFILTQSFIGSSLFYPILLVGIIGIVACTIEAKIPFTRAIIVGFISGLIYQILSPIFPLVSSILVGASLGGGLVYEEGNLKDVFSRILSILKGILLFPASIYLGGLLTTITSNIFNMNFLLWFFWGVWIGLGICLIYMPLLKESNTAEGFQTFSEVCRFKSETQEILRDLNQLDLRCK
jgi:hypothetical protein